MCYYPNVNDQWERNLRQSLAFLPEVALDDWERELGRLPGKCLSVQNSKQRFSSGTPGVVEKTRKKTRWRQMLWPMLHGKLQSWLLKPSLQGMGRLMENSVAWSYFMPAALLGNPVFSQISDSWRPHSPLARFCVEARRNPWPRPCQALQTTLGNFVGRLINFGMIKEFRSLGSPHLLLSAERSAQQGIQSVIHSIVHVDLHLVH